MIIVVPLAAFAIVAGAWVIIVMTLDNIEAKKAIKKSNEILEKVGK